jgi:hypothetical protein
MRVHTCLVAEAGQARRGQDYEPAQKRLTGSDNRRQARMQKGTNCRRPEPSQHTHACGTKQIHSFSHPDITWLMIDRPAPESVSTPRVCRVCLRARGAVCMVRDLHRAPRAATGRPAGRVICSGPEAQAGASTGTRLGTRGACSPRPPGRAPPPRRGLPIPEAARLDRVAGTRTAHGRM